MHYYKADNTPLLLHQQKFYASIAKVDDKPSTPSETWINEMNQILSEYKRARHQDKIRILDEYFYNFTSGNPLVSDISVSENIYALNDIDMRRFLFKISKNLDKYTLALGAYTSKPLQDKYDNYNYDNIFEVKNKKYDLEKYFYYHKYCVDGYVGKHKYEELFISLFWCTRDEYANKILFRKNNGHSMVILVIISVVFYGLAYREYIEYSGIHGIIYTSIASLSTLLILMIIAYNIIGYCFYERKIIKYKSLLYDPLKKYIDSLYG